MIIGVLIHRHGLNAISGAFLESNEVQPHKSVCDLKEPDNQEDIIRSMPRKVCVHENQPRRVSRDQCDTRPPTRQPPNTEPRGCRPKDFAGDYYSDGRFVWSVNDRKWEWESGRWQQISPGECTFVLGNWKFAPNNSVSIANVPKSNDGCKLQENSRIPIIPSPRQAPCI
jgi:hypothetical protein